ncbi:MAG: hypothetical protein AAF985_15810, partial [Bacteroidota bacterium]
FANTFEGYQEQIPPDPNARSVTHQYRIRDIEIKAWNGSTWVDYHPFEAMASPDALAALGANPPDYYYGQWQLMGKTHNKIRLLAETAFTFMQQGQPGWYTPQQFGITSATLFCETQLREKHCLRWSDIARNTIYDAGQWYQIDGIFFRVVKKDGQVIDWNSHFGISRSVAFNDDAYMEIVFSKACAEVDLKMTTFTNGADLKFYSRKRGNGVDIYTLEETRTLSRYELLTAVRYDDPDKPVSKVTIHPRHPEDAAIYQIRVKLEDLYRQSYESKEPSQEVLAEIKDCEAQLEELIRRYCDGKGFNIEDLEILLEELLEQTKECKDQLRDLILQRDEVCEQAEQIRGDFDNCFPAEATALSYEIYNEIDNDGLDEYRFRIWDNEIGEVILSSSTRYYREEAAREEMWLALNYALDAKAYQRKTTKDKRYYFNVVDPSGEIVARRIEFFKSARARTTAIKRLHRLLHQAVSGEQVVMPPIQENIANCPICLDHLDCWLAFGKPQSIKPINPKLVLPSVNKCNTFIDQILEAKDAFCKEYSRLYYQLYQCNLQLVEQCEQDCQDLIDQVNDLEKECEELDEYIKWIKHIIKLIGKGDTLEPPKGWSCVTLVHEVCCLSLEDHQFNTTVPGQAALEESYQNTVAAVEKMLKPIWRPDTKYYVRLNIEDEVWQDPASKTQHDRNYYFGFRTAGPVGYFHKDPHADYVAPGDDTDQYPLTSMRPYIDYQRSYPNADGNLILAKPLFYEDARILMFYVDRYVYHMFGDWPAYNGLAAYDEARLQVVVKDPVEGTTVENPAPPNVVNTDIPQAIESWPTDDDPRIPADIRALLNIRNPELLDPDFVGGHCWVSGGDMIRPASVYTEVTLNHLKPLKLYTALFNNLYRGGSEQVHRYVFQTSRYADFSTQINSYQLDDGKGNTKDAIFQVDLDLSNALIDLAYDIVVDNPSAAHQSLIPIFADPFDRILEGAWKIPPLDAAISTEFNILKQEGTGKVFAIWIRNPEPFNDPKIPESDLARGISVLNGAHPDNNYKLLYSKDRSQAMIMNTSKNITSANLNFRFIYLEWDGSTRSYIDKETINVGPINL